MSVYEDVKIDNKTRIRTFTQQNLIEESTWHRDRYNRRVLVLSGLGWSFQREDMLPERMVPGNSIDITQNEWHRILPGEDSLVLLITDYVVP